MHNDKQMPRSTNVARTKPRYKCFPAFTDSLQWAFAIELQFTSESGHYNVREGANVTLPCCAQGMDDDTIILWNKYDPDVMAETLLSVNFTKMVEIPKFILKNGWPRCVDMILLDVHSYDSGEYECSFAEFPDLKLRHSVDVRAHLFISIVPDVHEHIVEVGEPIVLTCSASGSSDAKIIWKRLGDMNNVETVFHTSNLTFPVASASHAGVYECTASSEDEAPVSAAITVVVHAPEADPRPPVVTASSDFIPVTINERVSMNCTYSARPPPQVSWIFNGYTDILNQMKNKERLNHKEIKIDDSTERISVITIDGVRNQDFGNYTCRVINKYGSVEKTIFLSGIPGKPYDLLPKLELHRPDSVLLVWSLPSSEPIVGYKIFIATENSPQTSEINVPMTQTDCNIRSSYWKCAYNLKSLQPSKTYNIAVQCRNDFGWGLFSDPVIVRTTDFTSSMLMSKQRDSGAPKMMIAWNIYTTSAQRGLDLRQGFVVLHSWMCVAILLKGTFKNSVVYTHSILYVHIINSLYVTYEYK
ncbi:Neurotrimin [Trichinella pseudospiralis]|uniref:Neurotrimin n=1 Tax=Trichinella pseudospiralis TaxID=6337 RepID=A0A0V1FPL2_TRIPS|nr:Neurotrimin [Trichinella pseudospiralis]